MAVFDLGLFTVLCIYCFLIIGNINVRSSKRMDLS